MKQNERLLVYAVAGFLALILVVAVVFGDAPRPVTGAQPVSGSSLGDILGGASARSEAPAGTGASAAVEGAPEVGSAAPDGPSSGLSGPVAVKVEQPLRVQAPTPQALVTQKIGPYRRDRTVRFVVAQPGDGFANLAQRWCGKVDGFVDEVQCLNETTSVLREGREYAVPWVDDEVLLALLEAEQVPTLVSPSAPGGGGLAAVLRDPASGASATSTGVDGSMRSGGTVSRSGTVRGDGIPRPANGVGYTTPLIERRDVESGGARPESVPAADAVGAPAAPSAPAFATHKVKSGDMLWPILARKFGNGKVPKALELVEQMNPGIDVDRPDVGATIKLPTRVE